MWQAGINFADTLSSNPMESTKKLKYELREVQSNIPRFYCGTKKWFRYKFQFISLWCSKRHAVEKYNFKNLSWRKANACRCYIKVKTNTIAILRSKRVVANSVSLLMSDIWHCIPLLFLGKRSACHCLVVLWLSTRRWRTQEFRKPCLGDIYSLIVATQQIVTRNFYVKLWRLIAVSINKHGKWLRR